MTLTSTEQDVHLSTDLPLTLRETGGGGGGGGGATVLVLHGGGGHHSIATIVDHFAPAHHVLSPTHPGWDGTPRPDRLHSVSALAAAYLNLLASRGFYDVWVLGSSFGGWVAAEMAIQDSTRSLGRLVLLGGVGLPPKPQHRPKPDPAAATSPGQSPQALALMQAYTGPDMWDDELPQRLSQVSIPALVVSGEHDPVLTPDYGRAYAHAIPGARFSLITAAGHLPAVEAPEPTFAAIDAFLHARTGRTGAAR